MIEEIFKIKKIKVEKAEREVIKQEKVIEKVTASLKKAKLEATDYHKWRISEEIRLFDEAKSNFLKLRQLEDLQKKIAAYVEKEFKLNEDVEEIKVQLEQEKEKLVELERLLQIANKAIEKFKHLVEEEQLTMLNETYYKEEMEQEDNYKNSDMVF